MVEMHKNPITFWVFYLKLSQYPRYQQFTTLCINSAADKINHEKHVSTEDNHKLWFLAIIILELAWLGSKHFAWSAILHKPGHDHHVC